MMLFSRIINAYNHFFRKSFTENHTRENEPIKTWQADFFSEIMYFLAPFSIVIYIPSLIMCIKDRLFILAVFITLGLLVVQYIFFTRKLNLSARKITLLIDLYLLGLVLLYYMGWIGPGLIYLLGVSLFATLIHSKKAGYVSWLMNVGVFVLLATLSGYNIIESRLFVDLAPAQMLTIGLNYMLLNIVLVASIASLMKGLRDKILSEREMRNHLQEEMTLHKEAKKRAEESDRLKTAFLQNMSHEIRTPLNSICGFAEILIVPGLPAEEQKRSKDIIISSSDQLLSIVTDILSISAIEAGQEKVNLEKVSIYSLLNIQQDIFNQSANKKSLTLSIKKLSDNIPHEIYTDKTKISQILINLISNALKFTHKGSIELGCKNTGDDLEFFVKDTGIGIATEKLDAIFGRFVQADETISAIYGGTGLGLSICKGLIDLLGGKIWVESIKGKGTTFFFTVPYQAVDVE
jgi:signal transduction histidine kinase